MPHWLATFLVIAASVSTAVAFAGVVRNKIIRPLGAGYRRLMQLLEQIRDASTGVQKLAREIEALAGALGNFIVAIKDQVDRNTERLGRLEELHELVIDLAADIHRINRRINDGKQQGDK